MRKITILAGTVLALLCAAPARAVTITEFPVGAAPRYIEPGPDGNIWFAYDPGIGRISPMGERFAPILSAYYPVDLITAPDGTVYWAGDSAMGQRTPDGGVRHGRISAAGYAVALTADGQVRNCLFAREESDLRSRLRAGASDEELAQRWRAAMLTKRPGHGINDVSFLQPTRPMSAIGG